MRNGWLKNGSKVQYVDRAPQMKVAERVNPILTALNDNNWEESFGTMLAEVNKNRDMDPILKVNLLQQLLDVGIRGSHFLENSFRHHLKLIKEAKINAVANWLDPFDVTVATERKKAAKMLQDLPAVDVARKALAEEMKGKHFPAEFCWIGWLHLNSGKQWECLMKSRPPREGSLFVVRRQSTEGRLTLDLIGQLDRNGVAIDAMAGAALLEGRPVYLKVP